jgi:hypothetical protein
MEISGIDLLQALYRTSETTLTTSSSSTLQGSASLQSGSCSESLDISVFGKLRSAISQMSDEEKEEMMAFHETMMEAVKNGTFDAAEMAADAPEPLKTFAEENGIDLTEMLEKDASMMKNRPNGPGGPPPPMMFGEAVSGMSDEEKEEMQAFLKNMMEAVKSGAFDASEMAANAPEALKSYAEENGIDLESALEDEAAMMEKRANAQNAPPPPPPDMYGSNGYGTSSSSQDLTLELLKQLIAGEDGEETLIASLGKV